jgi:hypothetical protein
VAIWAWQAAPGWSVSWGDCREEASSQGWKSQPCSGDSSAAQGRSNLIPNAVWWTTGGEQCIYCQAVYILVYTSMSNFENSLSWSWSILYFFILDRAICCTMHGIGIIWCWNIIKLCPCMKNDMISSQSIYLYIPNLIICFWHMLVYTSIYSIYCYILVCPILKTVYLELGLYCLFFISDRAYVVLCIG